ncbi:LysR family transcriptional regulator [Porticoccaceae bacterium LTM1]|nr:LysR family transcriptional regulator [Porticoccaceae bacterium LTM1]
MYLDLDTFRTLSAIVEEGSFAKAAERLNRSQSAVSYKIKQLEQFLGAPVFDRSSYRATLTESGEAIHREGLKLLRQMRHIEHLAQQHQTGWEPRLDLIIDGALSMTPVLRALKAFEDQRVPTAIQLHVEHLHGVQQRFEKSPAAIMLTKEYTPLDDCDSEPLPPVRNLLVTATDHPLAGMKEITRQQLQQYAELTVRDSAQRIQSASVTGTPLFGGERVYFLSDFQQKRQALRMGLGFGWAPQYLIKKELEAGELLSIDYKEGNQFEFVPVMVWHTAQQAGRGSALLLELLRQEFQSLKTTG